MNPCVTMAMEMKNQQTASVDAETAVQTALDTIKWKTNCAVIVFKDGVEVSHVITDDVVSAAEATRRRSGPGYTFLICDVMSYYDAYDRGVFTLGRPKDWKPNEASEDQEQTVQVV